MTTPHEMPLPRQGGEVRERPGVGGVLTAGELALLRAVQDSLVPREGDLPGAGELGAAGRVDGYLAERPALRPLLLAALQAVEVETAAALAADDGTGGTGESGAGAFEALDAPRRDAVLRAVETAQPLPFRVLLRQTYNAYYTHPEVLRAVGYGDRAPQPEGWALEPFDESRLDRVRAGGPRWREA